MSVNLEEVRRLENERAILMVAFVELRKYSESSDFKTIPTEEQELIHEQDTYMVGYGTSLSKRIALAKKKG